MPARRLLGLLAMLDEQISKLDQRVQQATEQNAAARLLMKQPGAGPDRVLAFVLTMGDVSHFRRGKQMSSYVGLIPREKSSGGQQTLGAISKPGNRLMRSLLVEVAQISVSTIRDFAKP
jgi:transposase